MGNDRTLLYKAIIDIEDYLTDKYHSAKLVPPMEEAKLSQNDEKTSILQNKDAVLANKQSQNSNFNRNIGKTIQNDYENDSLDKIASDIKACSLCRLYNTRKNVVPGFGSCAKNDIQRGNLEQKIVMVVGEGPGYEEDKTGLPFVGPAGQLLDKMLGAINLSRNTNCYICNIVKCRPPNNRDPAPDEQEICMQYLERQIAVIKPIAILAMGRIPSQALTGQKDGITRLRGKMYNYKGIPLAATYHPSALLHNAELKRPTWEDLKKIRSFLETMR